MRTWDADSQKEKGEGRAVLLCTFRHTLMEFFPHSAHATDVQQPTRRWALKVIGHDAEKNGNTSVSANLVNTVKLKHTAERAKKSRREGFCGKYIHN